MHIQKKVTSSTTQWCSDIPRGGGESDTKFGDLCARFVDFGALFKTQTKNGLSKLFNLRGHTIDASDQATFNLNYLGLHDEEGRKINTSDPLTLSQRRSADF